MCATHCQLRLYRRLFALDKLLPPRPGGSATAIKEERRASRKRPRGHPFASQDMTSDQNSSNNRGSMIIAPGLLKAEEEEEEAVEALSREGVRSSKIREKMCIGHSTCMAPFASLSFFLFARTDSFVSFAVTSHARVI